MLQLATAIPDADQLLALEPEELAAHMLLLLKRRDDARMFNVGNIRGELWNLNYGVPMSYPRERQREIDLAIAEALAWLEAQGLIVPAEGMNGSNGWRHLSRRAARFESQTDFANFVATRRLPKDALHPAMAEVVWQAFLRGQYDVAVFQAMKAVEVAVRDAAQLSNDLVGVKLMQAAFAPPPKPGPLTDLGAEGGEQVARMALFTGAIGSYKNPQSHRDVNLDDPAEAIEIIMLANHLLRIVDARAADRCHAPDGP